MKGWIKMDDAINLKYNTIFLRKLTADDVCEKYLKWVNDPQVTEFLEIRHKTHTLDDLINYVKSFDSDNSHFLFGIFLVGTNEHVGNGTVYNVNYIHRTFDIGCLIGEKQYWGTNVGLETILMLFKFGFENLKMRKFFGGCYANHISSRFILKRSGCLLEARLTDKFVYKDKLVDTTIYSADLNQWSEMKKKFRI
jgi:RimJ/RimL family protein N-acetyltransferase